MTAKKLMLSYGNTRYRTIPEWFWEMVEVTDDVWLTQERVEHILDMNVEGSVVNTSYGDRVTNVELALTMRTRVSSLMHQTGSQHRVLRIL